MENDETKLVLERVKLYLNKMPEDGKFSRVHAILLTKDGRVLLRYKNGEPRVTGGRIDAGDIDLAATLKREIKEEINCVIDKCDYLGYIEAEQRVLGAEGGYSKELWARMVVRIAEIGEPKADPDREHNWIYGRTLAPREIATEELAQVKVFGENNIKVLNAAYEVAREEEYFTGLPSMQYEVLNVESHD